MIGLDASDLVEVTGLDVAFVTVDELGFAVAELALSEDLVSEKQKALGYL